MRNYHSYSDLLLTQVYPDQFIQNGNLGYTHKGGIYKKRQLLCRVLMTGLHYILLRIVVEGKYYHTPFAGKYFFVLYMGQKKASETAHILARRKGVYRRLDLLATGGKICQMKMYIPNASQEHQTKYIQLPMSLWNKVLERMNARMPYTCSHHIVSANEKITHAQVMAYLQTCFPQIDPIKIKTAFSYGLYRLSRYLSKGVNVHLKLREKTFRAYRFEPLTYARIARRIHFMQMTHTEEGRERIKQIKEHYHSIRGCGKKNNDAKKTD